MSKDPMDPGVDVYITQFLVEGTVGTLGSGYIHMVVAR
jgi:hypothetical protein